MTLQTFSKGSVSTIATSDFKGCAGGAVILTPGGMMSIGGHGQLLSGPGTLKYLGAVQGMPTYQLSGGGSTTIALHTGQEGIIITRDRTTIPLGLALAWCGGSASPPTTGSGFQVERASYFR